MARAAPLFAGRGGLFPWQRELVDVARERDPHTGLLCYDTVIVIVGRRAGKSVVTQGVPLSVGLSQRLWTHPMTGDPLPYLAAATAQNMTAATRRLRATWETLQAGLPVGARESARMLTGVNHAQIELRWRRRAGSRWEPDPGRVALQVFPPTPHAVRGDKYWFLHIDEALSLSLDDGMDLLSAASPTLREFHGHAQLWIITNEALADDPAKAGGFLAAQKQRGRDAVKSGRREGVCYVEYSMDPEHDDPADPAVWHRVHPGLGFSLTEAALVAERDLLGGDRFAAEYLDFVAPPGPDPDTVAVDPGLWSAAKDTAVRLPKGRVWVGVDQDWDRSLGVAVVAGHVDGRVVVEVAGVWERPTKDTLVRWCRQVAAAQDVPAFGVDRTTSSSVAEALVAAGLSVVHVDGRRAGQAYSDLVEVLRTGVLAHGGDELLTGHVLGAARHPTGDGGMRLTRSRSSAPIQGAVALAEAVHLAGKPPEPELGRFTVL